ncbi:KdsC family phosphatase [Neolewinella litorea]|uniref:HAD family hydrolase n=1 Tax=Neolewinella litorea TaxID=2562452 RepID=A0A4S4NIE0_9BACT|nr:HAD hydrolase family protein [Neolewinella litorea]THH39516.1 HAD family hydrolase [Neolewinella litorea]
MHNIKLFITDIDGVWTDGGMYYDQSGNELKKFNTSDSAGVLFLRLLGIPTAIITGENTEIVKRRAAKLQIDHLYLGVTDKVAVADTLCKQLNININEVAYIGDDINDILLLEQVGLSACPENGPGYVKKIVDWVIPVRGGDGAFRSFVEEYLERNNLLDIVLERYLSSRKSQLNQ